MSDDDTCGACEQHRDAEDLLAEAAKLLRDVRQRVADGQAGTICWATVGRLLTRIDFAMGADEEDDDE